MSVNHNFTIDSPQTPYMNILNSKVNNAEYIFAINKEIQEILFLHKTETCTTKYTCLATFKELNQDSWFIYPYISLNSIVYEIEFNETANTCTFQPLGEMFLRDFTNSKEVEMPFGHLLILNEKGEIDRISHKALQTTDINLTTIKKNYSTEKPLIYKENIFAALPNIIIYHTRDSPQFDFFELKISTNRELKYESIDLEDVQRIQVPITEDYETAEITKLEITSTTSLKVHFVDADPDIWYFVNKTVNDFLEEDIQTVNKLIIKQNVSDNCSSSEDLKISGESLNFSSSKDDKLSDDSLKTHSLFGGLSISKDLKNTLDKTDYETIPVEKLESSVKLHNLNTSMSESVSVLNGFEETLSDLQPLTEAEYVYVTPTEEKLSQTISNNEGGSKHKINNDDRDFEIIQEINEKLLSQKIDLSDTDFTTNYSKIKEEFLKIKNTTNLVSRRAEIKRIAFKKTEYVKADIEFIKSLMYKKLLSCNSIKKELKRGDILTDLKKLNIKTNDQSNLLNRDFKREVEFIDNQILGYLSSSYLMEQIKQKKKERRIYRADELFSPSNFKEHLIKDSYKRIEASYTVYINRMELNREVGYDFPQTAIKNKVDKANPTSITTNYTSLIPKKEDSEFKKTPPSRTSCTNISTPISTPLFNTPITPAPVIPTNQPTPTLFTSSLSSFTNLSSPINISPLTNPPTMNQWGQGFQNKEVNLSNIFNKSSPLNTNTFSKTNKQDELLKKLEKDLNNK